jgi:processive 1,2-diacylglycerol beta-glucosyltransferase
MLPKRIILMYISEVSGHHSATIAIEKAIKILSPDSEIMNINAFNYTNPISEKIVNKLYMRIIKSTPKIWDYLYDNPGVARNIDKLKHVLHKFNSPKLKRLFDKFKPDAVLCTQAFPCGMVADYKREYNASLPLVAVLTDYVPHSYWVYEKVNYYITPSDEVSARLIKKGVSADKIRSLGIPFDPKFNEHLDRLQLMQKFRLNPQLPVILIMGGGQGLGPIKTIVSSLEKVETGIQEIIVAGTNKKLYKTLTKAIGEHKKKILLFSYAHNINEFMDIADLIISKPGGVTTAEVLAKKIPMIIVKPIPGQEANNTAYLTEKGAAIKVDEPKEINLVIERLLKDRGEIGRLRERAAGISKPLASLDIAKLLLGL